MGPFGRPFFAPSGFWGTLFLLVLIINNGHSSKMMLALKEQQSQNHEDPKKSCFMASGFPCWSLLGSPWDTFGRPWACLRGPCSPFEATWGTNGGYLGAPFSVDPGIMCSQIFRLVMFPHIYIYIYIYIKLFFV